MKETRLIVWGLNKSQLPFTSKFTSNGEVDISLIRSMIKRELELIR